jgi:hypothetical protein
MAPQHMKPFGRLQKRDINDAEAICMFRATTEHAVCAEEDTGAAGSLGAPPRADNGSMTENS